MALAARLPKGQTDIGVVARDLGTSARTLQRRLASVGLSYQELLDGVRRDAAERYIASTTLSIGEIAYLLGYSDARNYDGSWTEWGSAIGVPVEKTYEG